MLYVAGMIKVTSGCRRAEEEIVLCSTTQRKAAKELLSKSIWEDTLYIIEITHQIQLSDAPQRSKLTALILPRLMVLWRVKNAKMLSLMNRWRDDETRPPFADLRLERFRNSYMRQPNTQATLAISLHTTTQLLGPHRGGSLITDESMRPWGLTNMTRRCWPWQLYPAEKERVGHRTGDFANFMVGWVGEREQASRIVTWVTITTHPT
jgi:hypothetical protein